MATINLKNVFLIDKTPGIAEPRLGKPEKAGDGNAWDSTVHNGVTTPFYPIGQKRALREDATECPGSAVMAYLMFHDGTDAAIASGDVSDGYAACFHADGTASGDGSLAHWYTVTNDLTNSDGTVGGYIAFPVTDLSSNQYGWFWVGGVCPITDVTRLNAEIKTSGSVVPGPFLIEGDGTGFASFNEADVTDTVFGAVVGYSVSDDA